MSVGTLKLMCEKNMAKKVATNGNSSLYQISMNLYAKKSDNNNEVLAEYVVTNSLITPRANDRSNLFPY